MSWKEKTIARILLLLAQMLAEPELKIELKHLANHINATSYQAGNSKP